ncbi:MAG: thioredoxin domain-containing protein [Myxococcota bacterium]
MTVRVGPGMTAALLLIAFLIAPWAVFQWMELIIDHSGGELVCALDEVWNCGAVWDAPLAKSLHRFTGLPVAGWGAVWALAAFVAALQIPLRESPRLGVLAARIVGAAGILSCLVLFGVSLSIGAMCATCLVTYVLVAGYAGIAFFGARGAAPMAQAPSALLPVAAAVFVGWLALLGPGLATTIDRDPELPPRTAAAAGAPAPEGPAKDADHLELEALVRSLPPVGKKTLAEALESLSKPAVDLGTPRRVLGSPDAPILLTDFSDLRCPHCRMLALALPQLEKRLPGRFREAPRYFPLSANCNAEMPEQMVDPTGVRCFAAKVLLCLEDQPNYASLRHALFEKQSELTEELVLELAAAHAELGEDAARACQKDPSVGEKLAADIALAQKLDLKGTPLVLLDGREVPAHPTILFALLLARGDPEHPAFQELTP